MKRMNKMICAILVLVLSISLVGCGAEDKKKGKKVAPFEVTYGGTTYDLSMNLPELIGKFEENDVYVYDVLRFERLGKNGVYKKASGIDFTQPGLRVGVAPETYLGEELTDELEANRIMYSASSLSFKADEKYSFSFGKDVSGDIRSLSGYFNLDENTYDDTVAKLYSLDTADEARETLDKACKAEGFLYSPFWRRGCIAAVYFDGKQVDLSKYTVKDIPAFAKKCREDKINTCGEAVTTIARIRYAQGITEWEVEWEKMLDSLTQVEYKCLERELTIANAAYEGIKKAKKGEIQSVYVVRVDASGELHIEMYRKNGKVLVLTPEDEEYIKSWR